MRVHLVSDLHDGELRKPLSVSLPDADVRVIAGDIATYHRRKKCHATLQQFVDGKTPVLMVLGNHDHFGRGEHSETLEGRIAGWRKIATDIGITLLEKDRVVINGVPIIGATWWTACDWIDDADHPMKHRFATVEEYVTNAAEHGYNHCTPLRDVKAIRNWSMRKHVAEHHRTTRWLEANLHDHPLVITHHAPVRHLIQRRYHGDPTNATFANHRPDLVMDARAWLFGHLHDQHEFMVGKTPCYANPCGYVKDDDDNGFDSAFVIDIPS